MDIFLVFCCDFIPVAYQTPEMKTRSYFTCEIWDTGFICFLSTNQIGHIFWVDDNESYFVWMIDQEGQQISFELTISTGFIDSYFVWMMAVKGTTDVVRFDSSLSVQVSELSRVEQITDKNHAHQQREA